LNPKKQVAWVDFYDLTKATDEVYEFTLQEEGLVQWDNMVAVLNFKVKKGEVVNCIKLSNRYVKDFLSVATACSPKS